MTKSNHHRSPNKGITNEKYVNIAVVGLSGPPSLVGENGVGKSCLCNRFVEEEADKFYRQHISFICHQDFVSPVVNRCHFLYWGSKLKTCAIGDSFLGDRWFNIVEQTEFVDDKSFVPFKSVGNLNYERRCCSLDLESPNKLKYISKHQLGMEQDFEQVYFPSKGLSVDGFVLCIDVSEVRKRAMATQLSVCNSLYTALSKTKRPIVVALTKFENYSKENLEAARKFLCSKKTLITIETSAVNNVNCDLPFIAIAYMLEKATRAVNQLVSRSKIFSYEVMNAQRQKYLENISHDFSALLNEKVTNRGQSFEEFLEDDDDGRSKEFVKVFGANVAAKKFAMHLSGIKQLHEPNEVCTYLNMLQSAFEQMFSQVPSQHSCWEAVLDLIYSHELFAQYFCTPSDNQDVKESNAITRIPLDFLQTPEAKQCFSRQCEAIRTDQMAACAKLELTHLLSCSPLIGASNIHTVTWSHLMPYFADAECVKNGYLSDADCDVVLETVLLDMRQRYRDAFQELLFESVALFIAVIGQLKSSESAGESSVLGSHHMDIISDALKSDARFLSMSGGILCHDRDTMICRHIHFLLNASRQTCYYGPSGKCMMDLISEQLKVASRSSTQNTEESPVKQHSASVSPCKVTKDTKMTSHRKSASFFNRNLQSNQAVGRGWDICLEAEDVWFGDRNQSRNTNHRILKPSRSHGYANVAGGLIMDRRHYINHQSIQSLSPQKFDVTTGICCNLKPISFQMQSSLVQCMRSMHAENKLSSLRFEIISTIKELESVRTRCNYFLLLYYDKDSLSFLSDVTFQLNSGVQCTMVLICDPAFSINHSTEYSSLHSSGRCLAKRLSGCSLMQCSLTETDSTCGDIVSRVIRMVEAWDKKTERPVSSKSIDSLLAVNGEENDHELFYQSTSINDIRSSSSLKHSLHVAMCLLCGDQNQFEILEVLAPLLSNSNCYIAKPNGNCLMMDSILDMRKETVKFSVVAFHELADLLLAEDVVHGYIFIYSPSRSASLANMRVVDHLYPLNAHSPRILLSVEPTPDAPLIQKHNASIFSSALRSNLHQYQPPNTRFISTGINFASQTAVFTPFLQDVWNAKPQIEIEAAKFRHRMQHNSAISTTNKKLYQNVVPSRSVSQSLSPNHAYHKPKCQQTSPRTKAQNLFLPFLNHSQSDGQSTFLNTLNSEHVLSSSQASSSFNSSPAREKKLMFSSESVVTVQSCSRVSDLVTPLAVDTSSISVPRNTGSQVVDLDHMERIRSPVSPVARFSSRPYSMVDGGRTHVIDASSLNGGKSKSGSLRSTDDIEGSSSAGGASQSSNRSISSKVSLNRSKDNSTEDNLYDSIEMLNSGRRHTQLKTNESAASSVKSSVTRHATASSRQILMEHRKSNSHAAVNLQRDMGESGDSGGESATYSQVNRHTHHITHAKSQPCSPLPLGVSPRGSSQARRVTQMPPYKHGKSKSELVPCGIPVLDTSPIKPPLTQERLIYERMDSAESAEANNRGSKGSLLGSTIVQHGSSSRASVGSPISMTNTSGTPLNQQLSSSSSQDSRTKSKDWDLDRHSLDNNLTTFEDVGAHIYDEVAEEEERKSTNSGKKDLLAGQKVSAVIPKQTGKTKSSLSRSLDADSIVTGDDNAVKSETKKKTGKLRKQKSFTKKWLSNKTNSSATASNATPNSGSAAVPVTSASSYFGQPLEKLILIGNDGSQSPMPPLFVTQCIRYIELHGLDSEGIYRQPGNQCDREKLIHWFDKSVQDSGLSVQVNEDTLGPIVNQMSMPVDSVASALKQFFSKLPHPLIPVKYHDLFMRAALIGSGSSTGKLASHLALLPVPNYVTLRCLSLHLNKIANRCDVNKMTSENLATCFWPTLLRPAYTSLDAMSGSYKCRQLVEVIINRCHELFSYNTPRPDSDVQV